MLQNVRNYVKGASAAVLLTVISVGNALAALDASVDTTITAVQTDGVAMIGKGYALAGAVVGGSIVLGIFIKILRKAGKG